MRRTEPDQSKLFIGAVPFHDGKSSLKVTPQKWLHKRSNCLWKFIILASLSFCGIYICISVAEKSVMQPKRLLTSVIASNNTQAIVPCPKLNAVYKSPLHYPHPNTSYRDACSCMPMHYFVIFSMQRSGSGWFVTLLNSHPNITSHGELFIDENRRDSVLKITRTLDFVYDVDWVRSAYEKDCTAAVGLKWMLKQGVTEYKREVAAYLKSKSVSIIFLFRKNILRQYISNLANIFDQETRKLNGEHLAHVKTEEEAKVLAEYRPVVDRASLMNFLERSEESMNDATDFFKDIRHMTIYYEDLVANPTKELKRAQEFLGVKPIRLVSKHVKIHTRPLNEQIDNWDDLVPFLKGTRHEIYLTGNDYN
ncbi:hypothetical protein KP509_28G025500 [Ceratopteris richardii]|uniref:Sulfotransferase n=1 Tax=Ceratopteris richardii TaxID=49495 RepID=A0A8T2RC46_CERRI|nr:hypothetical protein KP509_28G025500 [Ceratopteris richardii]